MSTADIYNYRKVTDQTSTGGQPTENQLRSAAAEGFTTVINLALSTSDNALADEASLVRSLGMAHHHIPVKWDDPQPADFSAFENVLQACAADEKIFIHCAANFRVTAFYGLYAMKHLGWTEAQADDFRAPIWTGSHYPIWEKFIAELKQKLRQAPRTD
jgi:uncharacterized protein (TIGR01244 family)